jgi:hypothetical protein
VADNPQRTEQNGLISLMVVKKKQGRSDGTCGRCDESGLCNILEPIPLLIGYGQLSNTFLHPSPIISNAQHMAPACTDPILNHRFWGWYVLFGGRAFRGLVLPGSLGILIPIPVTS